MSVQQTETIIEGLRVKHLNVLADLALGKKLTAHWHELNLLKKNLLVMLDTHALSPDSALYLKEYAAYLQELQGMLNAAG